MLRIGTIFGVPITISPPPHTVLDLVLPLHKIQRSSVDERRGVAQSSNCNDYTENRAYAKHAAYFFLTRSDSIRYSKFVPARDGESPRGLQDKSKRFHALFQLASEHL